jgi:hypothetical protein
MGLVAALALGSTQGALAQDPMQHPRPRSRLADSASPYLRQHASNPVDWHPWGKEALERSKKEGKPIFLSIGYSSCHWCHVMERESFMDEATAALLNANFVCIKVDREERPDLDEIYMAAVQAMTGNGGWPMSVWLTPDLEPFYGGTYFPPEERSGMPSFRRVLTQLARVWREKPEECRKGGKQLTAHLRAGLQAEMAPGELKSGVATKLAEQSATRFDEAHGGFASAPHFAPKFPHASELEVLLLLAHRGDERAKRMASVTLDRMANGGLFDQIGYGFHRYSTDREWLVPHFEKMLYDNALLACAYLEASLQPWGQTHAATALQTLEYVMREMQSERGGFFSSQDADSEGEEGRFFVWTLRELREALGDDLELAASRWGVSEEGNWEGRNVLHAARDVDAIASSVGKPPAEVRSVLERCRVRLLETRGRRVRPATDDKVLASWNGMAIEAMARAWQVTGDRKCLDSAQRAASFVVQEMLVDGRLVRTFSNGRAQGPAFLDDYGFMACALLTLFEADSDPRWLAAARDLLRVCVARFGDDADGGFYFTSDDHESLIARSKNVTESSIPSGGARVAHALLRCGLLLGDEAMYARGERSLKRHADLLAEMPAAAPSLVMAAEFALSDPREVVIAGDPADSRTRALLEAAWRTPSRRVVVGLVHDGNRAQLEALSPVFVGKTSKDGVPAAYVCRRGACEAPVTDPKELKL